MAISTNKLVNNYIYLFSFINLLISIFLKIDAIVTNNYYYLKQRKISNK